MNGEGQTNVDLSLNDEDADQIVGGKKSKAHAKAAPMKSYEPKVIDVQGPPGGIPEADRPVDPGADASDDDC